MYYFILIHWLSILVKLTTCTTIVATNEVLSSHRFERCVSSETCCYESAPQSRSLYCTYTAVYTGRMDHKYRPVPLEKHVYGYHHNQGSDFKFDFSLNYKLLEIISRHSNNRPTLIVSCINLHISINGVEQTLGIKSAGSLENAIIVMVKPGL